MKRLLPLFILLLVTSIAITSIAQVDCPTLVEFALNSTNEFCPDTGRNQACFGHVNLSVEAQPDADDFEFVNVGDIVNVAEISSLRLSTLDTSAGAWGVVLMRLQANLPDSIPGQNITIMLFGDTEIRNNATSVAQQTLTTIDAQISSSLNANVRVGPTSSMATLASISNGTDVVVNGISPDDEWLRIVIPDSETDQFGWVSKQLIRTSDDLSTLNVITPGQPQFGPMQAFYLSTGIGEPTCNEMPDNGLLVQTPKGVGEINLLVNEVEISMGSTVFLSAPRDDDDDDGELVNANSMQIKTIEGAAISRVNGNTTVALGGSQFEVIYDDDGTIEEVSRPKRLELDEIDDLPYESLDREIEILEPLTDKELDILEQYDDVFDLVNIDQTDELLDYLDELGDENLIDFLQDELDIDYFDSETAAYFEDELGFDIDGYNDYGDDYDSYGDDYDDYSDGYDDYGDNYDDYSDGDGDYGDYDDGNYDDYSDGDYGDYDDGNYDDYGGGDYDDGGDSY